MNQPQFAKSTAKLPDGNHLANGSFAPGNKAHAGMVSGGRPKNWWYELIDKVITPNVWEEILNNAKIAATNGDRFAIRFLADQRHGLPTQRIEANVSGAVSITVDRKVPRPEST